jgi:type 1 glutamine amidotransferase
MKRRVCVAALAALGLLGTLASRPSSSAPKKIRVLMLTGQNNHNWKETSPHLEQFLEATGRFDVETTEDPATTLADRDKLKKVDVFLLNYNGKRWGEPAETNFLDAVRSGTGVSVIHAANNAFPGWTEYEKLVGITWRATAGHGPYHEFPVKYQVKDHAITKGLSDLASHPDELYHGLTPAPNEPMTILATAFSDKTKGGTGKDEPMALVKSYGKARVFHTPMGHDLRAMRDPDFMLLTARGTEWAAKGKVTIKGVAAP